MATKCMNVSKDRSSKVVGDSRAPVAVTEVEGYSCGQLTTDTYKNIDFGFADL
jgi:hypothetical protein